MKRVLHFLGHRWPTLVAIAAAVPALLDVRSVDGVEAKGALLPLLPLIYVVLAKLDRPRWTWPVLGISVVLVFAVELLSVPSLPVYGGIAALMLIWSLVDGRVRDARFRRQLYAMLAWSGLVALALTAAPGWARVLIGLGWIGHAVWDYWHLRRKETVSASYAEACGVLDLLIGVGVIAAVLI